MSDLFSDFDICGRRSRGSPRSAEAHHLGRARRPSQAKQIIAHLRACGGATCEEISIALNIRYTTVSARLSELKEAGWIAVVGQRRTSTGCLADVVQVIREESPS